MKPRPLGERRPRRPKARVLCPLYDGIADLKECYMNLSGMGVGVIAGQSCDCQKGDRFRTQLFDLFL